MKIYILNKENNEEETSKNQQTWSSIVPLGNLNIINCSTIGQHIAKIKCEGHLEDAFREKKSNRKLMVLVYSSKVQKKKDCHSGRRFLCVNL